jgi:hypothetical protein
VSEPVHLTGPRYLDGINLDADILAVHPVISKRQISDPVNDGSLGKAAYAQGSTNKDGSSF